VNVFQTITQKAAEAGLPFLVIGGYAVMAHGFVRATDDLDSHSSIRRPAPGCPWT